MESTGDGNGRQDLGGNGENLVKGKYDEIFLNEKFPFNRLIYAMYILADVKTGDNGKDGTAAHNREAKLEAKSNGGNVIGVNVGVL